MEDRAAAGITYKRTGIDITQPLEFSSSKTPEPQNILLPSNQLSRPQLGKLFANDPPRASSFRKGDASATTRIEQSTSLENKM